MFKLVGRQESLKDIKCYEVRIIQLTKKKKTKQYSQPKFIFGTVFAPEKNQHLVNGTSVYL
jgi:hypothetical protein